MTLVSEGPRSARANGGRSEAICSNSPARWIERAMSTSSTWNAPSKRPVASSNVLARLSERPNNNKAAVMSFLAIVFQHQVFQSGRTHFHVLHWQRRHRVEQRPERSGDLQQPCARSALENCMIGRKLRWLGHVARENDAHASRGQAAHLLQSTQQDEFAFPQQRNAVANSLNLRKH